MISLEAPRATARAAAAVSAFTFSTWVGSSMSGATVETTGMRPAASRSVTARGSTSTTSPTCPTSTCRPSTTAIRRRARSNPPASLELALDAEPGEHRGDLRPAAVHDHRVQAHLAQEDHVLRERPPEVVVDHGIPAVLDNEQRAGEALQPGQCLDQHLGLLGRGELAGLDRLVLAHVEYALFSLT